MARLAYYLKMTRFKLNLLEESDLDPRCLLKGDSNPKDKYALSERAVWTMNFDTIIIKIGWKMGSYGHLKNSIRPTFSRQFEYLISFQNFFNSLIFSYQFYHSIYVSADMQLYTQGKCFSQDNCK